MVIGTDTKKSWWSQVQKTQQIKRILPKLSKGSANWKNLAQYILGFPQALGRVPKQNKADEQLVVNDQ